MKSNASGLPSFPQRRLALLVAPACCPPASSDTAPPCSVRCSPVLLCAPHCFAVLLPAAPRCPNEGDHPHPLAQEDAWFQRFRLCSDCHDLSESLPAAALEEMCSLCYHRGQILFCSSPTCHKGWCDSCIFLYFGSDKGMPVSPARKDVFACTRPCHRQPCGRCR